MDIKFLVQEMYLWKDSKYQALYSDNTGLKPKILVFWYDAWILPFQVIQPVLGTRAIYIGTLF